MITLSNREREIFTAWLQQEIAIDAELIAQTGRIGASDEVAKHYHAEMLACEIVLKRLKGEPNG